MLSSGTRFSRSARSVWKTKQKSLCKLDPVKAKKLVIYKDDDIIALNKPSGLAVQGSAQSERAGSVDLVSQLDLWQYGGAKRPALAHRIDKNTTGVLMLTRNKESARRMVELFEQRKIVKKYWAIIIGKPSQEKGSITVPIGKKDISLHRNRRMHRVILRTDKHELFTEHQAGTRLSDGDVSLAWTKYSVISSNDEYCSLLDIQLLTGFKHQIRVHLADGLGCPILGDYQFAGPLFRKDHLLGRKMDYIAKQRGYTRGPVYLHAYEVRLPSQESGKSLVINASLPDYFVKTLRGLGLELPHKYKSLAKIK